MKVPCPNPDCASTPGWPDPATDDNAIFGAIQGCYVCQHAFIFDGEKWLMLTPQEYVLLVPAGTRALWESFYRDRKKSLRGIQDRAEATP